jgi:hypothetical protein
MIPNGPVFHTRIAVGTPRNREVRSGVLDGDSPLAFSYREAIMKLIRFGARLAAVLALAGATAACGATAATPVSAASVTATPRTSALALTASVPPKHGNNLNGVSCTRGTCYAVGYTVLGATSHTLIEAWRGGSWTREPSPAGVLSAISCAAGTARCLALGLPVLLAGSGGSWHAVTAPSGPVLDVLSCPAARSCVLAGWTAKSPVPVYATWNGKAFTVGAMHAPPHSFQSVTISGIACVSADDCVAVGDYSYGLTGKPNPNARDQVLAERWNGRTWQLLPAVNVAHFNQLTAVSCVSAANCTAIGNSQQQLPLAEHWNGSTWRVEPSPIVNKAGDEFLTSISCPSARFCVATGGYQQQPVAETWNGHAWRVTLLPEPSGDTGSAPLYSVACLSASRCVAVGTSTALSFAEVYASGKWHLSAPQNPVK